MQSHFAQVATYLAMSGSRTDVFQLEVYRAKPYRRSESREPMMSMLSEESPLWIKTSLTHSHCVRAFREYADHAEVTASMRRIAPQNRWFWRAIEDSLQERIGKLRTRIT